MYPKDILPGIDLYTICLGVAFVAAILVFRMFSDRYKLKGRFHNFCIYTAMFSIPFGYFSAILFQAFYNIKKYGGLVLDSKTGATFYGGLIGGALSFILIYFCVGRIWYKDSFEHLKNFFTVANIASAAIALAHGIGRIGCLMAGCCYGKETDAWFGIYLDSAGAKVIPTQLFEAIVLFCLFAFFVFRLIKNKKYNLSLYMSVYGAWRFAVEYIRDDYRGSTVVDFLTPSQLVALLMILGAVGIFVFEYKVNKKAVAADEKAYDIE